MTTQTQPWTKYDPEFVGLAYNYALLGASQERMASLFGVDVSTLYQWRKKYPELEKAIQKGGKQADATVAHALYRKAVGYDKEFVKRLSANGVVREETTEIKHYPPDTGACIQWLKARGQRDEESIWNFKEEGDAPKPEFDDTELARKVAFILAKAIYGETIEGEAKRLDKPSLI